MVYFNHVVGSTHRLLRSLRLLRSPTRSNSMNGRPRTAHLLKFKATAKATMTYVLSLWWTATRRHCVKGINVEPVAARRANLHTCVRSRLEASRVARNTEPSTTALKLEIPHQLPSLLFRYQLTWGQRTRYQCQFLLLRELLL